MKTTNKTQTIVDSIKQAVMAQRLPPGTKLREEHLSQIYQVSRTLVRQALQQLAKDRLVTLPPGRVAYISQISRREAREIFDARLMLEQHVLKQLASQANPDTVRRLRAHLEKEHEAIIQGNKDEGVRLGAGFHLLLAKEANNQLLTDWLNELLARVALIYVLYQHEFNAHTTQMYDEHKQIVDAIESGDVKKAAALMPPHLSLVQANLMSDAAPSEEDSLRMALTGGK